jgi:flavorubredoxin
MQAEPPLVHHGPLRVGPGTWAIRQLHGEGLRDDPVLVNSFVIGGPTPALIDTGAPNNVRRWQEDLAAVVDPSEVRFVVVTHDDVDHCGNLALALEMCPRAVVVGLSSTFDSLDLWAPVPPSRQRVVAAGDVIELADRSLWCIAPPVLDSPTIAVFDDRTHIHFAADAFGLPVAQCVEDAAELSLDDVAQGLRSFARSVMPLIDDLTDDAWFRALRRVEALDAACVISSHGPALRGRWIDAAFAALRSLKAGS